MSKIKKQKLIYNNIKYDIGNYTLEENMINNMNYYIMLKRQ